MLAIDTNVIVRFLTGDDHEQSASAGRLIGSRDIFFSSTVLLETEWILRGVYRHDATRVIMALRGLAGLPNVTIEDAGLAAQALDRMESGMDFADSLHLSKSAGCEAFVTFDKHLIRAANRIDGTKVQLP